MAFLKCVSTYGAEGVPGQYLERNLLCDNIADVNGLFGDDSSLVASDLNGTCPSVCVGDVFNVFVKNRDNETFRLEDNKFRPEFVDNWEPTNMRLTCVYVKRDEHSDKLNYALFIPHAKSKIVQPVIPSGDEDAVLTYNNSLFISTYVVNIGARTDGAETVTVNDAVFDFKNQDPFKYIICSVAEKANKTLTVSKSGEGSKLLFCAVSDTNSSDVPVAGDVVTYSKYGDLQQAEDFLTVLPYDISPKGVRIDIYPYDETKNFDAKPVFQLKITDNGKTTICDNILAGIYKPILVPTGGHKIVLIEKTVADEQIPATVKVSFYI
jgi:hypothetical protein